MFELSKNGKTIYPRNRFRNGDYYSREAVLIKLENARREAVINGYYPVGYKANHEKIVFMISNGDTYVAEEVKIYANENIHGER